MSDSPAQPQGVRADAEGVPSLLAAQAAAVTPAGAVRDAMVAGWRRPMGLVVAAALLLAVAVTGGATFQSLASQRYATALAVCQQARDAAAQALWMYRGVLDSATVRQAAAVKPTAVKDPGLVGRLARGTGLEKSLPAVSGLDALSGPCPADKSTVDLSLLTFDYRSDRSALVDTAGQLLASARAVLSSQLEFSRGQLAAARPAAERAVAQAQQRYGTALGLGQGSGGLVIDDVAAQVARGVNPQTAEDLRGAGQAVRTAWDRIHSGLAKAGTLVSSQTGAAEYDAVRQELAIEPLTQATARYLDLQAQAQAQIAAYQQAQAAADAAAQATAEAESAQAQSELAAPRSGRG